MVHIGNDWDEILADEWEKPYDSKYNVKEGEFTTSNGEKVKAEFMYSDSAKYIYDENAEGFIKKYKGNYAFAALLPKEGMSIEEYVSTLNGEKISQILGRKEYFSFELYTQLPKFETDYTIQLKDVLKDMGMKDAFVPHVADFTKTGDAYGLHISSVLQKTYISVGEKGTRAGAVTAITYAEESCPMETKTIALNRPFVYMLVDTTTNTPFFIGTMMNPS
jgi:serpin B